MTTSPMLARTRIKICGLTRAQDVRTSVRNGADALGFVFYPASKRFVSAAHAAELCTDLPAFVSTVALFVNPEPQTVKDVLTTLRPSLLQFHGDEDPDFCASFGVPYLKAFRVGAPGLDTAVNVLTTCRPFSQAAGWLFDSYTAAFGGSGHGFDYALLADLQASLSPARPLILSGGLTAQNVQEAVRTLTPWAVDVSSGVEVGPGVKSEKKIEDFVQAVQQALPNPAL
ncbi:MAG: phosphoribosylanthranilate isomerase [Alcaligenaceae bacterium]|nr:MAG: phosphoribosylanthranilate isomerase [Alcaligenaceae bacterium]